MKFKLRLLLSLLLFICALANSIPVVAGGQVPVDSITSVGTSVAYWDILLSILCLMILVPFVYIAYLKKRIIPDNRITYSYKGGYDAKNIIEFVKDIELVLGKRFSKFKKAIEQYNKDSEEDLSIHAEVIDSVLFCIKLNGKKRLTVFWNFSDTFLKYIILLLPILGVSIVLISYLYFGLTGFVWSLSSCIFILPISLIIFSYFLQFSKYIFKKRGKAVPALNIAFFAMEALINWNVERTLNKKTGEYYYYTTVHEYNNEVNSDAHLRGDSIITSSSIYGNLKEHSMGEKYIQS